MKYKITIWKSLKNDENRTVETEYMIDEEDICDSELEEFLSKKTFYEMEKLKDYEFSASIIQEK